MKPSSNEGENGSPRLSQAQLEKITFCQNCGAPFRISEPVNKKVKPLIPREGTIPGLCLWLAKNRGYWRADRLEPYALTSVPLAAGIS